MNTTTLNNTTSIYIIHRLPNMDDLYLRTILDHDEKLG
jgi:hypothetical protein